MHKLSGAHLKELGVDSIGDRLELLDIFQEELRKSKAKFEHISVPVELIVKFKKVKDGENEHQVVFTVNLPAARVTSRLEALQRRVRLEHLVAVVGHLLGFGFGFGFGLG